MTVDGPPRGSRLDGRIRLVIVESPDVAAPLVGALDAADVGAWVWVEAEHALYFSPRVLDLLNLDLSGDRPLLSRFLSPIFADDRALVRQLIEGHFPAGPYVLRYRYANPDGTYHWIEDRGRVERDPTGRLVQQGGALRDVTTEVLQEEERREATARLEALVNAIPFAVWGRSGPDLPVTHQNATSRAWWGDLLGRTVSEMPRDIARRWRAQIADALQGSIVKMRNTYRRDDRVQVLDEIIAPVTVGGEATGVVGVGIDVTDEQRRHEFEALLTDIAADFVSCPSDALDTTVTESLGRIAVFVGATSAALSQMTQESVHVTHWWRDPASGRTHPYARDASLDRVHGLVQRLLENRPVIVSRVDDMPDGIVDKEWLAKLHLQSFAIVPARCEDEQLIALSLAGDRDQIVEWPPDTVSLLRLAATLLGGVLARRRAEASRQIVNQRVQDAQKLESLGVLAGGIAHDFNNLLTAILGNASLLRAELPFDSEAQGSLEQIEMASRRAADLCRQLLAYAGRGRFALEALDLNDLVRESESLLRVSIPTKSRLHLDLATDLPAVLGDDAQLRQVMMNLVINAGEAIGDREGTITIATGKRSMSAQELPHVVFGAHLEEGDYVTLQVRDTGCGMPAEMLSRIFDPFFTTKFTGRGLGLAAVVGIIRAHNGALRVDSTPGTGSTFEVLLRANAQGVEAEDLELPDGAALAEWRTSGTALVVDDAPGVRELLRNVLQHAGFNVVLAKNGRAGVETFRATAQEVRVVLIDLTMPGLDGRQALAAMRETRPDVPAILMSGYTASDAGPSDTFDFLQKPFTPAEVRRAVWKTLRGMP